jgi:1-aminocyclopropane-1-carboxylate deaminase/D-cysteine desulfhydrase-like pyridoxal-dependent ACC family enzyme
MLFSGIPRVRLLDGPTPLEPLSRLRKEIGCGPLYVKRDDCMPLGMGGNKIRSLEFWLGQAKAEGADVIVVAGAPVSNQCRLAAAAAAKIGLDCLILHSSDRPAKAEGNYLLNRILGAEIRFLGPVSEGQRGILAQAAMEELRNRGRRPYLIGNPALGALGYVSCAVELFCQAANSGIDLQDIVLPGSMGPTETGFILGNALLGNPFHVHLVSVEYSTEELSQRISKIYEDTCTVIGKKPQGKWDQRVDIYEDYLGKGYDHPTQESLSAIKTVARLEGLFLENTYTSKTFAGMIDLTEKGRIAVTKPACVLHTGGTPALFAQQEVISSILED